MHLAEEVQSSPLALVKTSVFEDLAALVARHLCYLLVKHQSLKSLEHPALHFHDLTVTAVTRTSQVLPGAKQQSHGGAVPGVPPRGLPAPFHS